MVSLIQMDYCPHLCLNAACSLGSMSSLLLAVWLIIFSFLPLSSFKACFLHEASLTTPVFIGLCPLSSQVLTFCTVQQEAVPLKSWPLLLKGLAVPAGACVPQMSHISLGQIFTSRHISLNSELKKNVSLILSFTLLSFFSCSFFQQYVEYVSLILKNFYFLLHIFCAFAFIKKLKYS